MTNDSTDIAILKGLISLIKVNNGKFSDDDIKLLKGIYKIVNDRWITIHPHGDDSDDYRRIKLEDGETPKEAIDRVYRKGSEKEKPKDIKLAGVKKGEPMSFERANEGKVNPNFKKGKNYTINCQCCVAVFEARLRGFNIEVLPFDKTNTVMKELAIYPEKAYINPQTNEPPKRYKNFEVTTNNKMLQWLNNEIKRNERYGFIFDHGRGRHIITVYKTDKGELKFYDPQTGETTGQNMLNTIRYRRQYKKINIKCPPEIFRMDDTVLNTDYINKIAKAAKK